MRGKSGIGKANCDGNENSAPAYTPAIFPECYGIWRCVTVDKKLLRFHRQLPQINEWPINMRVNHLEVVTVSIVFFFFSRWACTYLGILVLRFAYVLPIFIFDCSSVLHCSLLLTPRYVYALNSCPDSLGGCFDADIAANCIRQYNISLTHIKGTPALIPVQKWGSSCSVFTLMS